MNAPPARRALVIGLDAATWDVIDPLFARGELPNLQRLVRAGTRSQLRSTVPPHTFSAWPVIMTGKNPGQLGIYSYYEYDPRQYERGKRVSTARALVGKTWFDIVAASGARAIAYGVPMTYPAWPINGAMVSGFPTPDLFKTFAYPPELEARVPPLLPDEPDAQRRYKDPSADGVPWMLDIADRYYRSSIEQLRLLVADGVVSLCMVNENFTDFFAHRFWWLHDPAYPTYDPAVTAAVGDAIEAIYCRTDVWIGELVKLFGADSLVAIVSDHGSGTGSTRLFSPNAWLQQQGLLHARADTRRALARGAISRLRPIADAVGLGTFLRGRKAGMLVAGLREDAEQLDWSRSRAYWIEMYLNGGGVQLNVRGRQPQGSVEPGADYERLRSEIIDGLLNIRDPETGTRVVEHAFRREELYRGPAVEAAPDIVFLNDPDYRTDSRLSPVVDRMPPASLRAHSSGDHRALGVLALSGEGVFQSGATLDEARVEDVLPTLLHAMGMPVPADVDGHILRGAFETPYLDANEERVGEATSVAHQPSEYSSEEEEGIRAALRGMGYID